MTSVTSGRSLPMPFARASCAGGGSPCLRTWTDTGLLGLPMSLETLPAWGCLLGGELYELPTPGHLTDASGCSSLPTPKAGDGERGRDLPRLRPDESSRELATAVGMLPTPLARDAKEMGLYRTDEFGPNASDTLGRALANHLLPTPTAQAAKHGETPDTTANGFGSNLWDVPSLLPTPLAQMGNLQRDDFTPNLRTVIEGNPLLPTPTVMDMGGGRTPEEWDAWKQAMKASHGNGNGHGASLEQEALSLGASTSQRSDGGNTPPDPRPAPSSPDLADDHDCLPLSWSG